MSGNATLIFKKLFTFTVEELEQRKKILGLYYFHFKRPTTTNSDSENPKMLFSVILLNITLYHNFKKLNNKMG